MKKNTEINGARIRTRLRVELKNLRELERKADKAERMYVRDPENEKYEKAFDSAYELESICRNVCVNLIVKFTDGKIDNKMARKLLATQRREIEAMV